VKQRRVQTGDLLELADRVTKIAGQAKQANQSSVSNAMNMCLGEILTAAKETALNEAMDRRREAPEKGADER